MLRSRSDRSNALEGPTLVRRPFDLLLAVLAAVMLSPLLLLVACAVRWCLGRPVFFRQERAGRHGVPFTLLKFRTMTNEQGLDGALLADEARLTSFGCRLRSSSLDELPELWNVIRGEMAMVGPRPLPTRYLDRYTAEESRRHEVRPGITGWAQVNGRNATTWEERLAMDVWYVDNRSFWLDIKILVLTARAVVSGHGVSPVGQATMSELRLPEASS